MIENLQRDASVQIDNIQQDEYGVYSSFNSKGWDDFDTVVPVKAYPRACTRKRALRPWRCCENLEE